MATVEHVFQYVIPSLFAAVATIVVAWITIVPRLKQTQASAEDAAYAVNNNHRTHLRDDLDEKFESLFNSLETMNDKIDNVLESQTQTDRHLNTVDQRLERHLEDSVTVRRDINNKLSIIQTANNAILEVVEG